ncbi:hypothetical protein LEP1GSC005_1276 [Leptospira santarosai str. ST188]|nr:hypothetical protein LEP1GSC005_1276 [Leptospira santarosai str. ST188]
MIFDGIDFFSRSINPFKVFRDPFSFSFKIIPERIQNKEFVPS